MIITTVSGNKISIDVSRVVNVQDSWHEGRKCVYIAMDNKQGFSTFDTVERVDAMIQAEKGIIVDNPDNDCTPYQHPAFLRGELRTIKVLCKEINDILDGNIGFTGQSNVPELQALRERLVALASGEKAKPSPFTEREIQILKHMALMNMPIGSRV